MTPLQSSHLRVLDAPADTILPSEFLLDIGENRHDMCIFRGLISPEEAAEIVARVEARKHTLPWVPQDDPRRGLDQMCLLGCALTPYGAHPEGAPMDHYLREADRFRALYQELVLPTVDLLARVAALMSRAAHGRPVQEPTGPDGRSFPPATLRRMPPGHMIPTHVGRWFQTTKGYAPLLPQVRRDFQLSWFVTLQRPDDGGYLEVFDLQWQAPEVPRRDGDNVDGEAVSERWPRQPFRPEGGDLLLFNGGRWYHQVTRVQGSRPRFTFGGFCGFSHDMATVLRWS